MPFTGRYEICVWSPQKSTATTVTYTVNHAVGATDVDVDQTHCGGRWFKLGDFDMDAGQGSVVLTNAARRRDRVVMADAVKITKWPGGGLFDDDDDGDIDLTDFGGFHACVTGPAGGPVSDPCNNQDADGDSDVDLADFAVFQRLFGAS